LSAACGAFAVGLVRQALAVHDGNVVAAAKSLGLGRSTL